MTTTKTNILDLDRQGLADFFEGMGEKSFRSQQVLPVEIEDVGLRRGHR
ncbi:MAG: hypothetical protein AAGE01_19700 [Pseudomonadota bacterium]